jgi:hypothetical protein
MYLSGCEKLQTLDFVPIETSLPETNSLGAGYWWNKVLES